MPDNNFLFSSAPGSSDAITVDEYRRMVAQGIRGQLGSNPTKEGLNALNQIEAEDDERRIREGQRVLHRLNAPNDVARAHHSLMQVLRQPAPDLSGPMDTSTPEDFMTSPQVPKINAQPIPVGPLSAAAALGTPQAAPEASDREMMLKRLLEAAAQGM